MTTLHALTFDFWGTLYQNAFGKRERLALLEGALVEYRQPRPSAALEAAYQHAQGVFERLWREQHRPISTSGWLQEVLAYLEADLPEDACAALHAPLEEVFLHGGAPPPVPGVAEVLPRLARRYRLGIISDVGLTPGRVLRELLRRDGLLSHFQAVTFSDEVGATKPLAQVFLRTLLELRARPEQAAHVGDLPETDLSGARAVGMRTILFLGVSGREDGRPLADGVFISYDQLEGVLERLDAGEGAPLA